MNSIKNYGIALILPFVMVLPSQAASIKAATPSWSGVWRDGQGGIMTIHTQDGFLDISSKDAKSIYTSTCLIDDQQSNQAKCVGKGVNHDENFRFLYQSSLVINADGSITEKWQADFVGGVLKGEAVFRTQGNSAERQA